MILANYFSNTLENIKGVKETKAVNTDSICIVYVYVYDWADREVVDDGLDVARAFTPDCVWFVEVEIHAQGGR